MKLSYLKHLFFGFQGRIGRLQWWWSILTSLALSSAALVAGLYLAYDWDNVPASTPFFIVFFILLVWSPLAISAKRLHDRNKSAWWLLLLVFLPELVRYIAFQSMDDPLGLRNYAPFNTTSPLQLVALLICVWLIVDLGLLRGTTGKNRFGPDPQS